MCGIAGLMTAPGHSPDLAALDAMARAVAHRGPDGTGRHVAGNVALAHTRLAIIDLATGDQPIGDPGGAALIANAEIYNYRALAAALDGVALRTASDCEPPLHVWRREGAGFVDRLRGMYAVAIHDPTAGRLVLARDPFGIKPLVYAETAAGFAFASEPQALIAGGLVAPDIRPEARAALFQRQFASGADTIFEGIRRVLPGETLVIEGGRIVERRRRAALPDGGPAPTTESEALAALDAALADSVTLHQQADVPYGMFLSGGIDSSALLALMARLNDRPVRAYTAFFPGTDAADERARARAVAEALGASHVEVPFDEQDFLALLPEIAAAMDDPAADYACLPSYKLARVAACDVKVVLSGEGGDELLAGYGRYRRATRRVLPGRRLRGRGAMEGLGILRDEAVWRDDGDSRMAAERRAGRSALQAAQATDIAGWLPDDLLIKLDRCLMAHSVEGRTPYLDPVVASFAFRLPDALKVRRGYGKFLLRQWLAERVPAAEAWSKKQGFTVPVGTWIARHGARLGPLVAAQPGVVEACHKDAVERVFREPGGRAGHAAWILLFYALWHRRHVRGRPPAGDVFDCLSDG